MRIDPFFVFDFVIDTSALIDAIAIKYSLPLVVLPIKTLPMRTFEVTIDETLAENNPLQVLQNMKGVLMVEEKKPSSLTASDWVRAGRPATEEELAQAAAEAEASLFFLPVEEARKLTRDRFNMKWR